MAVSFSALPQEVSMVVMGMKTAEEVHKTLAAVADVDTVPPWTWREAQHRGCSLRTCRFPETASAEVVAPVGLMCTNACNSIFALN